VVEEEEEMEIEIFGVGSTPFLIGIMRILNVKSNLT
jgi:hypothetical protein